MLEVTYFMFSYDFEPGFALCSNIRKHVYNLHLLNVCRHEVVHLLNACRLEVVHLLMHADLK